MQQDKDTPKVLQPLNITDKTPGVIRNMFSAFTGDLRLIAETLNLRAANYAVGRMPIDPASWEKTNAKYEINRQIIQDVLQAIHTIQELNELCHLNDRTFYAEVNGHYPEQDQKGEEEK